MKTSVARSAIWLLFAWAVVLCAPIIGRWVGPNEGPTLPLVSLPWDPTRDVHSSLITLFRACVIGLAAAVLVEPAKYRLRQFGKPLYALLVVYQFMLIGDVLRAYAVDWWVWLLSAFHIVHLGVGNWREPMLPLPSPWPSLIVALAIVATILQRSRDANELSH